MALLAPILLILGIGGSQTRAASDSDPVWDYYQRGDYVGAEELARRAIAGGSTAPSWSLLLVRSLLAMGRVEDARREAAAQLARSPDDPEALMLVHEVARVRGARAVARRLLETVARNAASAEDAPAGKLVAVGEAMIRLGRDPAASFRRYFDTAVEREPDHGATYLVAAALASGLHDDAMASAWLERGRRHLARNPDFHLLLAKARWSGSRTGALEALEAALKLNPRHGEALVLRGELAVEADDPGASVYLDRALAVDPGAPLAWALRAALAALASDAAGEAKARARALERGPAAEVEVLGARVLSRRYRFAEAVAWGRRAVRADPGHAGAKLQLAEDLMRLGEDREGWGLVEAVRRADPRDVVAFNLSGLRKHLDRMAILKDDGVVVRMDPLEAAVYGNDLLALLREARETLGQRYRFRSSRPTRVEVFSDQRDFAVRTFGVPGGLGYQGVCFGTLVTMPSQAGIGAASVSWRSVLWHEYAHVVTLGLTGNKLPRWLSEGISVYEERRRDPSWGMPVTARFRDRIAGKGLATIGRLGAAFLTPPTPEDLAFAYFQAGLLVEHLVERYGHETLLAVLADVAQGRPLERALEARMAPLPALDASFALFAQTRIEKVPSLKETTRLLTEGERLLEARRWKEAKEPLARLAAAFPEHDGPKSSHLLLARAHRELGEASAERRALEALASRSAEATAAFARLVEIGQAGADPALVITNARRFLGVNPMAAGMYLALGHALERRAAQDTAANVQAIAAYRAVLKLGPPDPADVHFRLARLLAERDRIAAKRHVLDALAEAPRMREAHRLLLRLTERRP